MAFEHLGTKYDITPGSVTIDSDDALSLATWWAELLGVEVKDFGGFYWLTRQDGGRFNLAVQQVPEAKSGKNRVHVDFGVLNLEAAEERVVELGGTLGERHTWQRFEWRICFDPEGNEFDIARVVQDAA